MQIEHHTIIDANLNDKTRMMLLMQNRDILVITPDCDDTAMVILDSILFPENNEVYILDEMVHIASEEEQREYFGGELHDPYLGYYLYRWYGITGEPPTKENKPPIKQDKNRNIQNIPPDALSIDAVARSIEKAKKAKKEKKHGTT